jgi:hypothetical protein
MRGKCAELLGVDKFSFEEIYESGKQGVEVVREYRTTGRRSTAEGLETLLERVLVGEVDAIRADVLSA